jgi:hypothetical protein
MTLANLKIALSTAGASVRRIDGEYQVKLMHWNWAHPAVYFTEDWEDALLTGLAMVRRHNDALMAA